MPIRDVVNMMHKGEMEESAMGECGDWWKNIPEEKKKALMKAKMDFKIKKVQAKLDFLKEIQRIFG